MKNIEKYEMEVLNNVDYCQLEKELVSMGAYTRGLCRYSECKKCKRRLRSWLFEEYKESILDEVERKYLSEVIRPYRGIVTGIKKEAFYSNGGNEEYICIEIQHESGFRERVNMPNFERDAMYKGMEISKKYTLKELGL